MTRRRGREGAPAARRRPAPCREVNLRERLSREPFRDQKGATEGGGFGAREEDTRRRIAELDECVLDRALAQHARRIEVSVEQAEDQWAGEGRRNSGQAEGEDPRVEAAG